MLNIVPGPSVRPPASFRPVSETPNKPEDPQDKLTVRFDERKRAYEFKRGSEVETFPLRSVWRESAKGALFAGGLAVLGAAERQLAGGSLSAPLVYLLTQANAGAAGAVGVALGVREASRFLAPKPLEGSDATLVRGGIGLVIAASIATVAATAALVFSTAGLLGGAVGAGLMTLFGAGVGATMAVKANRALEQEAARAGSQP